MFGHSLCLVPQGRLVNLLLNLYCDCDVFCTRTHSVMGCMWHWCVGTFLMPLRMFLWVIPLLLLFYDLLWVFFSISHILSNHIIHGSINVELCWRWSLIFACPFRRESSFGLLLIIGLILAMAFGLLLVMLMTWQPFIILVPWQQFSYQIESMALALALSYFRLQP